MLKKISLIAVIMFMAYSPAHAIIDGLFSSGKGKKSMLSGTVESVKKSVGPLGAVIGEGQRFLGKKVDKYKKKIHGERRVSERERLRQEALAQEQKNKPKVTVKKKAVVKKAVPAKRKKTEYEEFQEFKKFQEMKKARAQAKTTKKN